VALPLLVTPAYAKDHEWKIDPDTSKVEFSVKHFMVSSVKGSFNKFNGTVVYDGKDLSKATVTARISTASIDTKNDKRDHHLKAEDILNAELFPTITFESKKVVPLEGGRFKIVGALNLHGIEREVTLNASPLKVVHKSGEEKLRARTVASGAVERKKFDVFVDRAIDKSGALVGEKVEVTLKINLIEVSS